MNTRNLPSHRFDLFRGVATNLRADELATKFMRAQVNMDSFGRFRTLGKVPGSTRVSALHGGAVLSLHFFEFFDLAGIEQRQQLSFAADGILRRIDPVTGALTSLQTGLYPETLREAEFSNRLHLTSPNQRGLPTGGIKYDGTRTTNWGVLAPGQAETVHESLDDSTVWTASSDVTTANSSTSIDGGGSTSVAKTGATTFEAYIERTGLAHNFAVLGRDTLLVYLFLPYGVLQQLATSGAAVQVLLGTGGFINFNTYNFAVGELVPGWNLLSMLVNAPDSTTGAGAVESNITHTRLRLVTSSVAQTFSGVLWDKMFSQAAGAPTATAGAAGLPNGDYSYRVAFVTEFGLISNGGPASNTVTAALQRVNLTTIPVSPDPQVVARYIYRDIGGDSLYRFVGSVDDNVTTTFADNVPDDSLGSVDLPLAGDTAFDNTPPGRLYATAVYNNRIFGISADDRFRLIVGELNAPEAARIVDQLIFDDSLEALSVHAYGLIVYGRDSLYLLTGDGFQTPFNVERLSSQVGANGFRTVANVKLVQMVQHESEVFFLLNPSDPWLANKSRLDHFREDLPAGTLADGFAVHDRGRYRVLLFNKGLSGVYDQIDVWQYATSATEEVSADGAGVDPQDIRLGAWHNLVLPAAVNPRCAVMVERTADLPELWIGGNDGYVYWLGDPLALDYANGISTAPMDAYVETHAVPLGRTTSGRGEPRFIRLNTYAGSPASWTVTLGLLTDADGALVTTTSFVVVLGPNQSSVIATVPSIGYRSEWCTVRIENNISNSPLARIRDIELFFVPRVDFRGVRAA